MEINTRPCHCHQHRVGCPHAGAPMGPPRTAGWDAWGDGAGRCGARGCPYTRDPALGPALFDVTSNSQAWGDLRGFGMVPKS